jgi:hypothetical protein
MKRLLFLFVIIFISINTFVHAGPLQNAHKDVIGVVRGSGGDTYDDILLFMTLESETLGVDDCYGSDSTLDPEFDAEIIAGAANVGSYGAHYSASAETSPSYHILSVTSQDIVRGDAGRIGFYVKINTWVNFTALLTVYDDGSNYFQVLMVSDDELRFSWTDGGTSRTHLASTSANISTGTFIFIELAYDASANYREIFVDGVSIASDSSSTINAISPAYLYSGSWISKANWDVYEDNIITSNDKTRNLNSIKDLTTCPK